MAIQQNDFNKWKLYANALADRANTTNQNLVNMRYANAVDPETALGFAAGKWLSNYLDRRAANDAEERAKQLADSNFGADSVQANTGNEPAIPGMHSFDNGTNLAQGTLSGQARNDYFTNQPKNPFEGTSAGTTMIDSAFGNILGNANAAQSGLLGNGLGVNTSPASVMGNAANAANTVAATSAAVDPTKLLGSLGNTADVTETAANTANNAGNALGKATGILGGLGTLRRLADGNYNAGDLVRAASFFSNPGTDTSGTSGAQEPKTLDKDARGIASELIKLKAVYEEAEKQGNTEVMQKAAESAKTMRTIADRMGMDLSPYGADQTLGDAQLAFEVDTRKGMRNALRGNLSSEEYYDKMYDELRKQGVPRNQARATAAEYAGRYQAKRISGIEDALYEYGIDPTTNALNDYGTQMVLELQRENPDHANALSKMYGLPVSLHELWRTEQAQNNNALNSMKASELSDNRQYQMKLNLEKQKQAAKNAEIAEAYQLYKAQGYSDAEALALAKGLKLPNQGRSGGGGRNGTTAEEREANKRYTYLKDWVNDFEKQHKDDDNDDWKKDVDYVERKEELDKYSERPMDPHQYEDVIHEVTKMIMSNKYTADEIADGLRAYAPWFADDIIENTVNYYKSKGKLD